MALPAQAGVKWAITPIRGGGWSARVNFTGTGQVTEPLDVQDMALQTVHIFGTFNSTTVSLLGYNANPVSDASTATPQALHRVNDLTATFSTIGAELLAKVVEDPLHLVAQSNGAVTAVSIIVVCMEKRFGG